MALTCESVCSKCGGSGHIVRRSETGEVFSRPCRCEVERQNRRRLERSGLAPVLDKYTFASYQIAEPWQGAIKKMARQYTEEKGGKWFFIGGKSGTGKTHICTAVCGALMARGMPCRYISWRTDSVALKAVVNDVDAYRHAMEPLRNVRVLYIDDFLKGAPTEADRNLVFDLINYRYTQPRAITIFSTEYTLDRVLDWDEAIGGRIAERCGEYVFNVVGKNNWRLEHD